MDDLSITARDSGGGPDRRARALARRLIDAFERPAIICALDVAACSDVLGTAGLTSEEYDHALGLLATVIYSRPDLLDDGITAAFEVLFANPELPEATRRRAGEVLGFLLQTPAAANAFTLVVRLLAQPFRSPADYDLLLASLEYATAWASWRLDLADLVSLAEQDHLAANRERLLHVAIERAVFARPGSITVPLLERLVRLFDGHPSLKYLLFNVAATVGAPDPVRSTARAMMAGQFPLHDLVRAELGSGARRVLVVQNISDGQGDEIIRVVPLLEAFLRFNPLLEVVLVTSREYLYAHSRITIVPIDDQAAVRDTLRRQFDAVVDFYEPRVPQVNHDRQLERQIRTYLGTHAPFLSITSLKGWNHFVYQRVVIQSRDLAKELGLDRQRVDNIYETTFRLIAELGLPLRLGEESPETDSVLAGLPCGEADAAWSELVQGNSQRRPVALVCPFGGVEPLKGYVEREVDALARRISDLIEEGFHVVLLPNGMPWGSTSFAHLVISRLAPSEREQVVVAPDPSEARGSVTYEHAGTHTVPAPSYQMRLVTYFVRFADLVVTVEGWMVHAAYCLGKRYRVMMLPYSHPAEWHPYGRTLHQDVVEPASSQSRVPSAEASGAPPLPEQPRKFVLLYLLKSLGGTGDAGAIPLLRWALGSEDRDVRLAAARSLCRFTGTDVDTTLRALLNDPANRVRGAAATALLERMEASPASVDGLRREHLLAHQLIGQEPSDWTPVARLGAGARSALEVALKDDDDVVRREAAMVMRLLDSRDHRADGTASDGVSAGKIVRQLLDAGRAGSDKVIGGLRGLRRPAPQDGSAGERPRVLILTPVKDAADCLDRYVENLHRLTYLHGAISLGFLESESADSTFADLERCMPALRAEFRRARVWKKDFGYRIPTGAPRWEPSIQAERRAVLAKSRNHLLFHALDDEARVL